MAQQTAVDWLMHNLIQRDLVRQDIGINAFLDASLKQAKQMEKEQRIKDYDAGYTDAQCNHVNDAENYANEQEYLNNNLKTN